MRTGSISPATACDAPAPASHPRIDRCPTECKKLSASEAPEPRATSSRNTGRHHVGMPGRLRRNPHPRGISKSDRGSSQHLNDFSDVVNPDRREAETDEAAAPSTAY